MAVDADGPNWPDHQVAKAYKCHQNTVVNVYQRKTSIDWAHEMKELLDEDYVNNGMILHNNEDIPVYAPALIITLEEIDYMPDVTAKAIKTSIEHYKF